jgi:transposase
MKFMRVRRDEWAKRVERWKDSGLTAKEFAGEMGINPRSLVFWKWQLGKGQAADAKTSRAPARRLTESAARALPMLELTAPASPTRFELELAGGRRLTIPATFEADALRRLLGVLEAAS